MRKLILIRLKATILEPMIAMMIILFSLTASFLIVVKAGRQTNIRQQVRASAEVDRIVYETIDQQDFIDETIENEGIKTVKEVSAYKNDKTLILLTVSAYDNKNRLMAVRRRILTQDEDSKENKGIHDY